MRKPTILSVTSCRTELARIGEGGSSVRLRRCRVSGPRFRNNLIFRETRPIKSLLSYLHCSLLLFLMFFFLLSCSRIFFFFPCLLNEYIIMMKSELESLTDLHVLNLSTLPNTKTSFLELVFLCLYACAPP